MKGKLKSNNPLVFGRVFGKSQLTSWINLTVKMYWQEAEPTLKLHQLLWEMPENTEYVIKNGQLIWRVRG